MSCELNVDMLGNNILIKLFAADKIGEGSYGTVYFLHKNNISLIDKDLLPDCNFVVKISKNQEDISNEEYFYNKYYLGSNSKFKILPHCFGSGIAFDENTGYEYNYIILEYVGCLTLKKVFTIFTCYKNELKDHVSEVNEIIKILYMICLEFCDSLHKMNLVCRDIKPENIIVNDKICSYLITLLGTNNMKKFIFDNLLYIIPKEITINKIIDLYTNENYDNILKFVDVGLFGDINIIYSDNNCDIYNKNFRLNFANFEPFDGLFVSTVTYLSPFSIFNLSSLINRCDFEMKRDFIIIISMFLKLSDLWIVNIMFAYYFCDIFNNNSGNYICNLKNNKCIMKNYYKNKYIYTYKYIDCTIFDINIDIAKKNKNIFIKTVYLDLLKKNHLSICRFIEDFIFVIIDIIKYINSYSSSAKNYFPFELNLNKKQIIEIKEIMNDFFKKTKYNNMSQKFRDYEML